MYILCKTAILQSLFRVPNEAANPNKIRWHGAAQFVAFAHTLPVMDINGSAVQMGSSQ